MSALPSFTMDELQILEMKHVLQVNEKDMSET